MLLAPQQRQQHLVLVDVGFIYYGERGALLLLVQHVLSFGIMTDPFLDCRLVCVMILDRE